MVDVICAYLRAPYTPLPNKMGTPRLGVRRPRVKSAQSRRPTTSALARNTGTTTHHTSEENRRLQEREARLTAQRILTRHLRPRDDNSKRLHTYWPGVDLDLNSATLIGFDLRGCEIRTATFSDAQFSGDARFHRAQFTNHTWFSEAQFSGDTWFHRARFTGDARFSSTQFTGEARFSSAQFRGEAWFHGARFSGGARFDGTQFTGSSWFHGTRFTGDALFDDAQFADGIPESLKQQLPATDT
ncbi:pentapeptide repeat-containing protein [Actinophytocola sp.]|uniref:pentapeptide repeat-containing protein n=1 Tax=Actinophytocola sp. TaxID=1872138 RepID=UPI003D6A3260